MAKKSEEQKDEKKSILNWIWVPGAVIAVSYTHLTLPTKA